MKKNDYKPYGGRRYSFWKRVLLGVLALGIALFCARKNKEKWENPYSLS